MKIVRTTTAIYYTMTFRKTKKKTNSKYLMRMPGHAFNFLINLTFQ